MRFFRSKQLTAFLLALCLLTALLAGCNHNGDEPSEPAVPSTGSSTGTTGHSEPAEPSSEPTQPSAQPTEPGTQPTTVPTEPTDPSTEPTAPPTEPQFPGVTWESAEATVYAISAVNVRSGPGTSYEKLGSLSQGEAVKRLAKGSNGWSRVEYKGQQAYISSNYLTTQDPAAPTEPQVTQPQATQPNTNQADKVIYLTFDDGPGSRTPELLAVLEKYNVKVTFFVMGDSCLEYLDDIAAAGHAIGIHTYSHKYDEIYSSTDAFWEDFYKMDSIIYERTGIHTNLHRFPGGSSNTISKKLCPGIMTQLAQEIQDKGYYYFDWNVDSDDAGSATTADEVYQNVISGLKKTGHSVVLMHDVKSYTVDAVEQIIQWGLQNGYTFQALDENTPVTHHTLRN